MKLAGVILTAALIQRLSLNNVSKNGNRKRILTNEDYPAGKSKVLITQFDGKKFLLPDNQGHIIMII
ncbi:MAG: hypothetical protein ACFCUM_04345 [Bacteroidales bacterium]